MAVGVGCAGGQRVEVGSGREVFPGVVVGSDAVLIRCEVSPMVELPREFGLEFVLCRRGARDHETLLETDALPSHVHAALLMIGLEPAEGIREGSSVRVEVSRSMDGPWESAMAWMDADDGLVLSGEFVFAGALLQEGYDPPYSADASGVIVGLCGVGDETVLRDPPMPQSAVLRGGDLWIGSRVVGGQVWCRLSGAAVPGPRLRGAVPGGVR